MKTHVIQLERDDDIISARDKMMWSKAPRILLVWPRRGRVLTRELDIVLVKRLSQQLGAQLALVTYDEDVVTYALEQNIPTFESVSEAQRRVWKISRAAEKRIERPSRTRSLREIQEIARKAKNSTDGPGWLRVASFAVGVMTVLVLGLFLLPGATVRFQLEEEVQRVEVSVYANPETNAPSLAGNIPVRQTSVIVEGQDQIESSGVLKLSDKRSKGEIVLTNLTDEDVFVEGGTIVLTLGDPAVRFETMEDVLVAADDDTAQVGIQAIIPGSTGNVDAGEILAMEGVSGLALSIENPVATTGGEDRDVPMATELDLTRLRERLVSALEESAKTDLDRMLGDSSYVMPDTIQVDEIVSEQQEPKTGEPGDILTLSMQVSFSARYIDEADLERVAQLALDANLPEGYTPVDGTMGLVEVQQVSAGSEVSEWQVAAERKIQENYQRDEMIRSLLGASMDQVEEILSERYVLTEAPQVHLSPSWWPRMPYFPLRIRLEEK